MADKNVNAVKDYTYVLFDLDGTLTDSGPGIMNGYEYALGKMGVEIPDRSFLKQFEEEFGTIYCKELQKAYVKEHKRKSPGMYRACTVFVEKAVELAKEMIEEKQ